MNEIQLTYMKKRVYSSIRAKKAEPFYFDDCYVCQATKKAEDEGRSLSTEELKGVFRKANEQN